MPNDGLISSTAHGVPVIPIDLTLPPAKRWLEAGEQHRKAIGGIADAAWSLIENHWNEVLSMSVQRFPTGSLFHKLAKAVGPRLRNTPAHVGLLSSYVARLLGAEYAAEVKGLAKSANIHPGKLFALNLSYDISQAAGIMGQACSSASFVDSNGHPVLARNLDWCMPDCIGHYTCEVEFTNQLGTYRSIGVLGFVGVLSAMRPERWAVTLNQAPCHRSLIAPLQMPACMLLRWACDASLSYTALKDNLAAWVPMAPFLAHMIGTTPNQQHLIQHTGPYAHVINGIDKTLAQTNHYLNPAEGPELNERCKVSEYCDRHRLLTSRLERIDGTSSDDAMKLLTGNTLTDWATQQQMSLNPATGHHALRVRPRR